MNKKIVIEVTLTEEKLKEIGGMEKINQIFGFHCENGIVKVEVKLEDVRE
jgi:hypothetical protein